MRNAKWWCGAKIMKRRRILMALRAVVIESVAEGSFLYYGQYHKETDALMLRISAFTHASFIGLQGRFLAPLEMTIRESDVFQSFSHELPVTSP